MFSPLKVKKKIDLAPSLNFAKSRKERSEDKRLQAQEADCTCLSFVEAADTVEAVTFYNISGGTCLGVSLISPGAWVMFSCLDNGTQLVVLPLTEMM